MQAIDVSFHVYIKNPFELSDLGRVFLTKEQIGLVADSAKKLHFVPKEWGQNHYIQIVPREIDIMAAEIAISHARALIVKFLKSELPDNSPFAIKHLEIEDLKFGCVKLNIWAKIEASAVVVALLAGCSTLYVNHTGNRSQSTFVTCNSYVTTKENIGYHLNIVVKKSPDILFDIENSACTKLKQKALQEAGLYRGKIDGKFGDKTANAEKQFAKLRGLNISETEKIYASLAEFLLSG